MRSIRPLLTKEDLKIFTEDQVLAMEPGEELDSLISKYVFGVDMVSHVPFSVDISAVWDVVSAVMAKGWKFILSSEGEEWKATFYWDSQRLGCNVHSEFAPEAICKAAILAVLNL